MASSFTYPFCRFARTRVLIVHEALVCEFVSSWIVLTLSIRRKRLKYIPGLSKWMVLNIWRTLKSRRLQIVQKYARRHVSDQLLVIKIFTKVWTDRFTLFILSILDLCSLCSLFSGRCSVFCFLIVFSRRTVDSKFVFLNYFCRYSEITVYLMYFLPVFMSRVGYVHLWRNEQFFL